LACQPAPPDQTAAVNPADGGATSGHTEKFKYFSSGKLARIRQSDEDNARSGAAPASYSSDEASNGADGTDGAEGAEKRGNFSFGR